MVTTGASDTSDPWGEAEPALTTDELELPGRLAILAAVEGERALDPEADGELLDAIADGDARAEELPEVAVLMGQGWRPLEPTPLHVGVPAAWPLPHRGWVPDRRPHLSVTAPLGPRARRVVAPYDPARFDDTAAMARDCGLPPPPAGRLWLLRSPWPSVGVGVLLALANDHGHQRQQDQDPSSGYRPHVALHLGVSELLSWTESQFWAWWDDLEGLASADARCARAWLTSGRDGEQSSALVLAGLFPADLNILTAPTHRDGAGLTEAQAVAWTRTLGTTASPDGGSVERVLAWRRLGLPSDPPPPSQVHLGQLDPTEAATWFDTGFTLDDVARLSSIGLDRAHSWHSAGFPTHEVVALLGADPTLAPEEAADFTAAGLTAGERRRWVSAGFDAADARAYADLDIYPAEARVWRAHNRGPTNAAIHREHGGGPLPDDLGDLAWFAYGSGDDRAQRNYQVTDPPGTRGRIAYDNARGRAKP